MHEECTNMFEQEENENASTSDNMWCHEFSPGEKRVSRFQFRWIHNIQKTLCSDMLSI